MDSADKEKSTNEEYLIYSWAPHGQGQLDGVSNQSWLTALSN